MVGVLAFKLHTQNLRGFWGKTYLWKDVLQIDNAIHLTTFDIIVEFIKYIVCGDVISHYCDTKGRGRKQKCSQMYITKKQKYYVCIIYYFCSIWLLCGPDVWFCLNIFLNIFYRNSLNPIVLWKHKRNIIIF